MYLLQGNGTSIVPDYRLTGKKRDSVGTREHIILHYLLLPKEKKTSAIQHVGYILDCCDIFTYFVLSKLESIQTEISILVPRSRCFPGTKVLDQKEYLDFKMH